MTNQTIKRKIKKAIEEHDTHNRSEVGVNYIRLQGITRHKDRIVINKVTISIDDALNTDLYDVISPLNDLEEEGIIVVNKLIEC